MSTNVPTGLPPIRDVRLALVLNGGVSLAIWIGGVTHEIDAARRGLAPGTQDDGRDTAPLYDRLNSILHQQVVVDVIGGASAGGINGVMLGAAIYTGAALPNLREVWIELGDFRKLLRPATSSAPPSLLRGDELVLSELSRQLGMLFDGAVGPAPTEPLDMFFPATDVEGVPRVFQDSTGRRFAERDPRRVFHFTSSQTGTVPIVGGAVRTPVWLGDSAASSLLAHAGRSSSSFPVAFEAHRVTWIDDDNPSERSLVDGGILDNQPFNPVLDAIGIHPASRPLRRVLLYVVPYVTEPDAPSGATATKAPVSTPALGTASAALNLPRELPKLQGLERVTRELLAREQLAALQLATRRSEVADSLAEAAGALFESYCRTRQTASAAVFRAWAQPGFRVGDGAVGQAPDIDAANVSVPGPSVATADQPTGGDPWIPAELTWSDTDDLWEWGFSPAERVAAWILLTLADARFPEDQAALHSKARIQASRIIARARNSKRTLSEICHATAQGDPISRAANAYASPTIVRLLRRTQYDFRKLNQMVTELNSTAPVGCGAATVQQALNFEVVRNAFGIQDLVIPPRFTFVMASAGVRNSLGHIANSPATKLAGMKLNHFGGFLKRSWRANDWLWGRLDGVEHLLNSLIDADRIIEIGAPTVAAPLAELAFALEPGAPETDADRRELERVWADAVRGVTFPTTMTSPQAQFEEVLDRALSAEPGSPEAARLLRSCRRVIAARVQLRILSADLERVAETAREDVQAGSSKIASGALWANRGESQLDAGKRVALFKDMHIGEETLSDETSSRYTADIVAQGAAVATSMLAGDRGGLPAAGRAMLGSVRNLTLATSFPIRLLAQQPLIGVAAFVVLIGLLVWAFTSSSALLGASLPALALLTAIVGLAVLTTATSVFEESPTTASRWVGWAFGFGAPFAFFLVALGTNEVPGIDVPGPDSTRLRVHAWFVERCGEGAVKLAGVFSLVAAVLAIALLTRRLLAQRRGTRTVPWRAGLALYRLTIIGALGSLIVGFIWTRATQHRAGDLKGWPAIANEHHGAVLIVVLVAALVAAGLVVELVMPSLRKALRQP